MSRFVEGLVCEACLRIRWAPWHLFLRLIGVCPGVSYH